MRVLTQELSQVQLRQQELSQVQLCQQSRKHPSFSLRSSSFIQSLFIVNCVCVCVCTRASVCVFLIVHPPEYDSIRLELVFRGPG